MPESALGAGDDETVLASFACFAAGGARGAAGAGASAEALAAFGALALALAAGALRFFGADRSGTTEDASASALASAAVTAPSAKKAPASGASQFGATWPNVSRQAKTSLSPPSLHATQSFGVHSEATAQQRREGRAAATESPDDFDCFRGIVGGVGSRMAAVREGGGVAGSHGANAGVELHESSRGSELKFARRPRVCTAVSCGNFVFRPSRARSLTRVRQTPHPAEAYRSALAAVHDALERS